MRVNKHLRTDGSYGKAPLVIFWSPNLICKKIGRFPSLLIQSSKLPVGMITVVHVRILKENNSNLTIGHWIVEQIAKYLKTCLKHRSSQAKYELKERRQMALEWEANWMKEKRETTFWLEISSINKEGKRNANMVPVPKLCKSQSVGMSVILELDEEGWFRIHLNPSWLANWDRGRCWHANKRGLASASEQDAF